MIPFFADAATPFGPVTATSFLAFMASAWLLLKTLSEGMGFWGRLSGKLPLGGSRSNPLHTTSEKVPTWAEVAALEKRVTVLEEKFEEAMGKAAADYRDLAEAGEQRAGRLMKALNDSAGKQHARIDQILAAVSRLEGMMDARRNS